MEIRYCRHKLWLCRLNQICERLCIFIWFTISFLIFSNVIWILVSIHISLLSYYGQDTTDNMSSLSSIHPH